MQFHWKKLGRIIKIDGQYDWMFSHSAMPQALVMKEHVRIFFGTRNHENRTHIAYVDIHPDNPGKVLKMSEKPVLSPGPWGCFDDNGLYPGNIVSNDNRLLMYYMGRSNGEAPLYYMAIGLAESLDGGETFQRVLPSPILGRTKYDPWMTSTPWVIQGEKHWIMYYLSGEGWESLDNPVSRYFIRSAVSKDGINWQARGDTVIPLQEGETNIAAPTVWEEGEFWHMIFCTVNPKTKAYKLGYAVSDDQLNWQRQDNNVGIDLSDQGWDSKAMAYPSVFIFNGKRYLLYSGNELGKEGIGIARMEDNHNA